MMDVATDLLSTRGAGVAAVVGLLVIVAFQLALALGAPLGRAAWGGAQAELSPKLRVASGMAVVIWLFAVVIVLGRVGIQVVPLPEAVLTWGTWILVVILILGAILNFASSSAWERFLWGPLALLIALLALVVALSA